MEWLKSPKNHHLILYFQLPHVEGITLNILCLKIFFQGSPPGNKPLIIEFPKNAIHCKRGAINPIPPLSFGVKGLVVAS